MTPKSGETGEPIPSGQQSGESSAHEDSATSEDSAQWAEVASDKLARIQVRDPHNMDCNPI